VEVVDFDRIDTAINEQTSASRLRDSNPRPIAYKAIALAS
jgi:hypothetical protein